MKKGFTLVELLAVIVILAVILIIAIPQIMNTIKFTRLKSMESSARLIATNAEKDYLSQQAVNQNYNATSIPCTDVAKLNDDYSSCTITYNSNGTATIKLKGASGSKFAGITCTGTKDEMNCIQRDNVSEYVYSFGIPRQIYTYTVNNEANCVNYVKRIDSIQYNRTEYGYVSKAYKICTNSSLGYNTSDYINESIDNGIFTYSQISSFVTKTNLYGVDFYTVTDKATCLPFIRQKETDNGNDNHNASLIAYKVCNNLNTIRATTTSDWFSSGVYYNSFNESDINSFTTKTTTDGVNLYTVTDASACKTFLKNDMSFSESYAEIVCSNSDNIEREDNLTANDWFINNESYLYSYTVTNQSACETQIKDVYVNEIGYSENEATSIATSICSGNGYDDGHVALTTSEWFSREFEFVESAYSFLSKGNAYSQFASRVYQGTETYANPSDINSLVFLRWPGDADEFDSTTDRALCIKYKGNTDNDFNCFTFDNTIDDQLKSVFGNDKCNTITEWNNTIRCNQNSGQYYACNVERFDQLDFYCREGHHIGKLCDINGRCGDWMS